MPNFQTDEILEYRWSYRCLAAVLLSGQVVLRLLKGKLSSRNLLEQMATVGLGALNPVLMIALFSAMIFTIQTARQLSQFGAVNFLGGAFSLAFCRELAPVLTASIIAGQVGSAYAAELGAMQVTEQIDALYMLRSNPIDYLVIPRVVACCLMLPILTVLALVVGIAGGSFVGVILYHLPSPVFLDSVRESLAVQDLVNALLKSFIFGAIIAIIGCSWGLTTRGGVKGIGRAATASVVTTWICIFIVDFFISLAIFGNVTINLTSSP
ncbi:MULTISPECIES: MlaE family lipid ABC transporter permease subunit [unclassified Coleofasciculus]|uniref:MlaE family lipid ABC transporter permease subunit n=1 Tax=unclassified Coleofasciculus TaxID=2692782 RepID=UPI001882C9B5|nr:MULTISPECIES: MlaE family lipid ABC transporter permease subunit [unclassified Coleofasciculus]MBE9125287.1 MlaE family lipid ABC transporter permease subunit [Coleofasciculus sp. LEGE 07081]MBE9147068.1 MlaE family lipid ABC transporter permease subunit [Coleofasciculus sp. LEGE 07092]